jgi:predicted SprT family Zn-dependent metalloprotease
LPTWLCGVSHGTLGLTPMDFTTPTPSLPFRPTRAPAPADLTQPAPTAERSNALVEIFWEVNEAHFDGFLDLPLLRWNARLRSSAGRFIPGSRKWIRRSPPVIEIASYLCEESNALVFIRDTIAHEMIHYWLWVRRRLYGHTPEFYEKMTQMGVSRYNPVPRTQSYKYVYRCMYCESEFPARRKLGPLACAQCCRQHARGKYDPRFKLELARNWDPSIPLNAGDPAKTI